MLVAIVVSSSALVGLALVSYAAYKIKARRFKVGVSVFKVLTVTFEVESAVEEPKKPCASEIEGRTATVKS